MARAIWTGAISFGLVSIPVGLFSATADHTVHFHQFERGTSDRIRYQRVNERTGKEVEYSDIVKGAPMKGNDAGGGEHVIVEPDELADIAPGRSRTIDITAFVDLDDIDPIFFQKTYWLAPTDEQYARPYALLREAMARTNRAGVATFVMRGKEYLTALRADGDVLALETLYFADEIRDRAFLDLPGRSRPKGKEMDMATGLIEAMSGPWQPGEFRDTFTERVEKLIEDKRRGREIVTEAAPPEPTAMTDLVAALERSVADARGGKKPAKGSRQDSDGAPDLSGLSKAELTKMARELDVKGRSSMSRAELQDAVAAASEASGTTASGTTQRRKAS
jgi:DNA end-binding protein Ku